MITIGVTLGDVTGIGPEVVLQAAHRTEFDSTARVLIGDSGTIRREAVRLGWKLEVPRWTGSGGPGVWQLQPEGSAVPDGLAGGAPAAAQAAVVCLREGAERCLSGEFQGLVTGPVSKESILRSGIPFVGQTEFLTRLAGNPETAMMLLGTDERGRWLRVALATTHLPLRSVASTLTLEGVVRVIRLSSQACAELGLPRRRIGVCGLNPHAGEGGLVGTEEQEVIGPAITRAREYGCDVVGPLAADTLFHQALHGAFDVVVAMYHDQGLGPLKLVAFDTGVNWTLGLPFVRTAPDHGTAYDIAGRGIARPDSMIAALRLAITLASAPKGAPGTLAERNPLPGGV